MDKEFTDLLKDYLNEKKTLYDCEEFLAGIDWDNPSLTIYNGKFALLLELIATEISEGMRSESEFRNRIRVFLNEPES